jgi:hypothetical protein
MRAQLVGHVAAVATGATGMCAQLAGYVAAAATVGTDRKYHRSYKTVDNENAYQDAN